MTSVLPTAVHATRVGPNSNASGTNPPMRSGNLGDLIVTQLHGRHYEQAVNGKLFTAFAKVTAPVIYSTAAGTGGPLLYNPTGSGVNAVLLGVGIASVVVTTAAAALGITGASGQAAAPGTTTVIDGGGNALIGGAAGACTCYRIGTPTNAGTFFLPLASAHTGALTVDNMGMGWIDLGGAIIVPPGAWASVAASVTATTLQAHMGLLYEEVPILT